MRSPSTTWIAALAVLLAGALPLTRDAGPSQGRGGAPGIAKGSSPPDTVVRVVERARSAAAGGRHGEAARRYRTAAGLAPELSRWLRLSALQHAARAGDTVAALPAARWLREDPVVWSDSVRLEAVRAVFEAGDDARGVEAAAQLDGDEDPALWVRHVGPSLLAAGDTARARRGYLAAATVPGAPAEAGRMLARLGAGWEELAGVARADLSEGRPARGREFLGRALEAAPAGEAPELALRLAEARLEAGLETRAHRTAKTWLGRRDVAGEPRARLEILAARSHLRRGQRRKGEVHLRRAMEGDGGERSARAAYLLAGLAHDRGERETARTRYREAAERFPKARLGGQARMRLGFMDLADDRTERAAASFRAYRTRRPDGPWALAALYWEGRSRVAAGDSARGADLIRRAARRDPVSYYGRLAARRIDADPLEEGALRPAAGGAVDGAGGPAVGKHTGPSVGDGDSSAPLRQLLDRMDGLRRLGWEDRALRELDVARADALRAAGSPLGLARRLHGAGWPAQGIGMGWEAFDRRSGTWSRPVLEAVYPLPHRDALTAAAARHGVPPALVAGVIRQESAFDPRAVSPAGAVGLMQLMPETAADLARAGRRPSPDEETLTDPELSLALGTRYLAALLDRFDGSRPAALIAYNAGANRYLRWRRYPEFGQDRELMVERIPFAETRRYVKAVLRNVYVYRRLYGLADGGRRATD